MEIVQNQTISFFIPGSAILALKTDLLKNLSIHLTLESNWFSMIFLVLSYSLVLKLLARKKKACKIFASLQNLNPALPA